MGEKFFVSNSDIGYAFSDDRFVKVDENTYCLEDQDGTYIIHMSAGKFTSFEYQPASDSIYEPFGGVYAPATPV